MEGPLFRQPEPERSSPMFSSEALYSVSLSCESGTVRETQSLSFWWRSDLEWMLFPATSPASGRLEQHGFRECGNNEMHKNFTLKKYPTSPSLFFPPRMAGQHLAHLQHDR